MNLQLLKCFLFIPLGIPIFTHQTGWAKEFSIVINAGSVDRVNCVMEIPLPEMFQNADTLFLTEGKTGKPIPVQVDRTGEVPKAVWIIRNFPAGEERSYRLSDQGKAIPIKSAVTVNDDGKHLIVSSGNKPILIYNHAVVESPIKEEPYYRRSGYIHPLYSPSGEMVTDDFNPDHAHQHGIMFSWRMMKFQGRITDTWNQKAKLGKVEHIKTESFGSGPVFGYFKVKLDHVDLTAPSGAETMLHETWLVKIYAIEGEYLFDLVSTQTCASDSPVSIEKMHYGGMAIRGAADWYEKQSHRFLTSEGKSGEDGNHTRPDWVSVSGPLEKGNSAVTIFSHSSNFRSPQPVRLHPKYPYFCFTPCVFESFEIKPGENYVSRFRFLVENNLPVPEKDRKVYAGYVDPPKVEVVGSD